jgi:hypothetical protein
MNNQIKVAFDVRALTSEKGLRTFKTFADLGVHIFITAPNRESEEIALQLVDLLKIKAAVVTKGTLLTADLSIDYDYLENAKTNIVFKD